MFISLIISLKSNLCNSYKVSYMTAKNLNAFLHKGIFKTIHNLKMKRILLCSMLDFFETDISFNLSSQNYAEINLLEIRKKIVI